MHYAIFMGISVSIRVFGDLKFVRLPKKLKGTGPHRGFAFVDFQTKQDAKVCILSQFLTCEIPPNPAILLRRKCQKMKVEAPCRSWMSGESSFSGIS